MEVSRRLTSPTPRFWKKVQKLGLMLSSAGATMLAVPETLPKWIPIAGGYVVLAGGIMSALATLTCEDQPSNDTPTV